MVLRRNEWIILSAAVAATVAGCGSPDRPVATAPATLAPAPVTIPAPNFGVAPAPTANLPSAFAGMKPIPHPVVRRTVPTPPNLVHPLVAPLTPPPSSAASAIPVNIVGNWQDDRGANLTFSEDGKFEIDAKSPTAAEVRAAGVYTISGSRATLIYTGLDIETSDSQVLAHQDQMRDEFMKKGPGAKPQIEAIEMRSKDEVVMRLVDPNAPPTVVLLKRRA